MTNRQLTPNSYNPMFFDISDMFQQIPPPSVPGGFPGTAPPQGPDSFLENLPPPPVQFPEAAGDLSVQAVDPGSFYGCLYRLTFVQLVNGRRFWFYPIFIGRYSVAGYRWNSRIRRWTYTGFDARQVLTFQCL
ncbi:hypothetical protein EDD68_10634 [Melghiribacillus thermohalophilus]|uniref:Transporter n=1 Tax=Melghiribacillus thermohalophilus TaxID=1324956 RepID=A0A4R3N4D2_9BACI|nr:transporter [Melghiribacillus thermohalophilus]TCT23624.1 hypothetical protein EDD68_10634 [Melghiribacillus thermohalophilus]